MFCGFESLVPNLMSTTSGAKASDCLYAAVWMYGASPLLSRVQPDTPKLRTS